MGFTKLDLLEMTRKKLKPLTIINLCDKIIACKPPESGH